MTDHTTAAQATKQEPVLTDNQIEALAKKHIAPHADRLDKLLPHRVPYQQTEQFRRVKALIVDVLSKLRAPVADERAAFEEAYLKITMGKRGGLGRDADGQYGHLMTRALWRGWKARAALASAPVACAHQFHFFGDQKERRCNSCGTLESKTSAPVAGEAQRPTLAVWYGSMPESNGKSNWTAILYRKDEGLGGGVNITLDRSEYPDRVRYEADRVRYLIGEIDKEPWILDYDSDKCDAAPQASNVEAIDTSAQRVEDSAGNRHEAAPQASEAAQILRKVREDGYLSDTMNHRIAVFLACQPQAGEAVRDGGAEPGTNEPESRANASDTVVLPPLPNTPYTSEGVYCDHWVWRDWQVIEWGRAAVLADRQQRAGDVRDALEMLIREAQAVAADYHRPRYTRLDEAIQSARAALSAQPGAQYHLDGRPTEPDNGGPVIKPEGK